MCYFTKLLAASCFFWDCAAQPPGFDALQLLSDRHMKFLKVKPMNREVSFHFNPDGKLQWSIQDYSARVNGGDQRANPSPCDLNRRADVYSLAMKKRPSEVVAMKFVLRLCRASHLPQAVHYRGCAQGQARVSRDRRCQ
jgi:hypothetical protein